MKKILFLAILFSSVSAFAGNGQCVLCEINRENNKKNPNPHIYYEDYLEAQKKGGVAAPAAQAAPATTTDKAPQAPAKP